MQEENPLDGKKLLNPEPSTSELQRVYIAFYILQHFCYLFKELPEDYGDGEIATRFLGLYPPWEVEALVCVKEYLHRRLEDVIQLVKEGLSKGSDDNGHKRSLRPPKRSSRGRFPLHLGQPGATETIQLLGAYSSWEMRETRLALGLQYLRRLYEAGPKEGKELLLFNDRLLALPFLSTALMRDPYTLQDPILQEAFYHGDEEIYVSEDFGPPAGWAWANGDTFILYYNRAETQPLRDWGYPFSDKKRLETWGILEIELHDYRARKRNLSADVYHLYHHHLDWCRRYTVHTYTGQIAAGDVLSCMSQTRYSRRWPRYRWNSTEDGSAAELSTFCEPVESEHEAPLMHQGWQWVKEVDFEARGERTAR